MPIKMINMMRGRDTVYGEVQTLDSLWDRANALGEVGVNGSILAQPETVSIAFTRPSGSRIDAKATHTDIRQAFALAIEEAISLGTHPR